MREVVSVLVILAKLATMALLAAIVVLWMWYIHTSEVESAQRAMWRDTMTAAERDMWKD